MTSVLDFEKRRQRLARPIAIGMVLVGILSSFAGCGSTKSFTATEQLLVSDAVDTTVSKIDFRPLMGRKVFLDNSYLPTQKGVPNPNPLLVHSEYVSSSLRQQMLAAGVFLCEKKEDAEVIVEARLGALGFDGHSVTYGLPASNSLSTAASTLTGTPIIPLLPELSFAKKEAKSGAAKIALFAYERDTLQPVWQSGISRAASSAKDTWVLGVGPMQSGTVYEGPRFAGSRVFGKTMSRIAQKDDEPESLVDYKRPQVFTPLQYGDTQSGVATASNEPGSNTPHSASNPSGGKVAGNGEAAAPAGTQTSPAQGGTASSQPSNTSESKATAQADSNSPSRPTAIQPGNTTASNSPSSNGVVPASSSNAVAPGLVVPKPLPIDDANNLLRPPAAQSPVRHIGDR